MKKFYFWSFTVLAASVVVALTTYSVPSSATNLNSREPPRFTPDNCPDGMECADCSEENCYASETIPEGERITLEPDSDCDCTTDNTDADCHYEYISAYDCAIQADYFGWAASSYGTAWGVGKRLSDDDQLILACPIPTDHYINSIKDYADVGQVKGYFYHDDATTPGSYMYIYSSWASSGTTTGHGYHSSSSSGQQTLTVNPTGTKRTFWYAFIWVQDNHNSVFHGLQVCYDPD